MLAERRGVGEGVYVESVVFAPKAVEEEVSIDLASQLPAKRFCWSIDVLAA